MSFASFRTDLACTKSVRTKSAWSKVALPGSAALQAIVPLQSNVTLFARLLGALRIALISNGNVRTESVRTVSIFAASVCTAFSCTALVGTTFIGSAFAGQSGKVVEYGVYSDDYKLLKKTTNIPIQRGVRFGFCFEAKIDFSEDDYMLVETLAHPPLQVKDSGEDSGYSVPRMFEVRDGVAHGCSGYRARDVYDLRPGVWKFTISDGEEVLVVQEFSIR